MSENHRWLLFKRIWNSRTVLKQFGIFFSRLCYLQKELFPPFWLWHFVPPLSFFFVLKTWFFFLRTQFLFRNQSNYTKSFFVIISHIMKKKTLCIIVFTVLPSCSLNDTLKWIKNKWIVYKTSLTIFFLFEASMSRNEVFFFKHFFYTSVSSYLFSLSTCTFVEKMILTVNQFPERKIGRGKKNGGQGSSFVFYPWGRGVWNTLKSYTGSNTC